MEMSCKAAATAVNGEIITAADQEAQIERIVIDSRDVRAGDFFVPLAGEHTDGHRFVTMAAQKGAVGCFINRTAELDPPSNICVIVVDDTLAALQTLAHAYRLQFTLPVVGVTGSVGKTTTKDLLGAVLAARFKVLKTAGNLNNQIGLPIMLSRLDKNVQVAVLEMGMSGFGEIDLLARLAAPLVGVITNIGESHLEMLGSRAGIARAKCELLQHLPAAGAAVVNADEPLLEPYLKDLACKVISFGFTSTATLRCTAITTADTHKQKVQLEQVDYPPLLLEPPLPGRHNIYNLMAAVAVARELGIEDDEIQAGLGHIEMSEMRLEMVSLPAGYTVINDAYNASPTSMAAALHVLLEEAGTHGKIAVLGDMLELGAFEEEGHRQIGCLAAASELTLLLVLGLRAKLIAEAAEEAGMAPQQIIACDNHVQAAETIREKAHAGDWILLKGSRGMRMEEILTALRREM